MTEVQRLAKIMILKDMRKEYELRAKYNGGVDYDCYRALDMAIEKLEQEPCTDAISRQAVLEAISNEKYHYWALFEYVRQLPPVTPAEKVGQWIPVSERLPEDKTYVLTTIKVPNRIAHARSGWYEGGFFHNDNGDTWKATDIEVIAWMPLPEPYKASPTGAESEE